MQRKLLDIINVDSDAIGQLLIIYSVFVKYLKKKWKRNEALHQLFIDFKKAYDSGRRPCTIFSLSLVSPRNW